MAKTFFLLTCLVWSSCLWSQTGTVVFRVSNIQQAKGGEISAGIFTKENFPKVGKQFKGAEKTVIADMMEISLEEIPVGTYGAVAFQDIDLNKDLNTNFIGFPKEPIGFANGAAIKLGPPSFEDASIQVKSGQTTIINITLN